MQGAERRATTPATLVCDGLGLGFLLLALADYLRPGLLLLPTVAAGGDTPSHYPTFIYFREHLLPALRLHGWYPGTYLGQPLLLYYFPLPFLIMAGLAPWTGPAAAFKLGTALGVFLLPLFTYAAFRLLGFRFPGPLLGAAAAFVFLFLEDNPIWGGTLASTLTGEFSYTYGIGLGVLFLGVVYRGYARGYRPIAAALVLALTALAHGYAVLWAGISATYFLYAARRPARTLLWLLSLAGLAFVLAGFWILPLLSAWGWTTAYDDPWISVTSAGLLPAFLWPLFACAAAGGVGSVLLARRSGGPDHRLMFLLHAALVGAALALAGPALGIIDVRFVPFAQLALCLCGAATLGLCLERLARPEWAAIGLVLLAVVYGDARSKVLRYWIDWNYTGLEAKERWPAFEQLSRLLRGSVQDPRVAVEYSQEHEKAGSIRMYETLPYFSGRSTLEGVYNQASVSTHAVYYVSSELGAVSPNPFKNRHYSQFDTDAALRHLRLLAADTIVALSPKLVNSLEARDDVTAIERIPPYTIYRLTGDKVRYVEPLAFAPIRSSPKGWREKAYRWFTRRPLPPALLVFSDDPRFERAEPDEWLPPPSVPLAGGVEVQATLGPESVTIHTNRPGHPLLVKISYHPRWRARGADGPFLVSPSLMMVIPRGPEVRLEYGRDAVDGLGLALTAAGFAAIAVWRRRSAPVSRVARVPDACPADAIPPRRWGGAVPGALLLLLAGSRLGAGRHDLAPLSKQLYERASRAYAAGRLDDAAEYARQAQLLTPPKDLVAALACLRGESLARRGRPAEAALEFDAVANAQADSPYLAQALAGSAETHAAAGDPAAAAASRARLFKEFPDTPWADRLRSPQP